MRASTGERRPVLGDDHRGGRFGLQFARPDACWCRTPARSKISCSEMLRPMLKSWLDDNLPAMVERLVRAEIERVSRGRG